MPVVCIYRASVVIPAPVYDAYSHTTEYVNTVHASLSRARHSGTNLQWPVEEWAEFDSLSAAEDYCAYWAGKIAGWEAKLKELAARAGDEE